MISMLVVCIWLIPVISAFVALPPRFTQVTHQRLEVDVTSVTWETFDQYIDHDNPALGTFQQRYWYSTEFWDGPGSPVILCNLGEISVLGTNGDYTGYLGSVTLIGQYAEAVGGASILIEHRYWGESSPYSNLTAENLQYLTVSQSIQDMVVFAKNVVLPFDDSGFSNAQNSPWVFVGGSYSGALAAWTQVTAPGTFWAYHASSAPVQSVEDYWQYFYSILQGMASNCSTDIQTIVGRVDTVLTNGTSIDQEVLKAEFGLGIVVHNDDFARTISLPLESWQDGISSFLPFCDAIEGAKVGHVPSAEAIGLTNSLPNYARYINENYGCTSLDCYDSYNVLSDLYVDTTYDPNVLGGRQWQWMLCNEGFGWWPTGAPADQDTLVSRFVTTDYFEQECGFYFPNIEFSRTEAQNNEDYLGWDIADTNRLMFSNGEYDPWRSAGVSSDFRPGGPVPSTPTMPIFLIAGAVHTQDLYMDNVTPEVLQAMNLEIDQLTQWINEYYEQPPPVRTSSSTSTTVISTSTTTTTTSTTTTTTESSSISSSKSSISLTTSLPTTRTTLSTSTLTFPTPTFSIIPPSRSVSFDGVEATKLVKNTPNIPITTSCEPSSRRSIL